MVFEVPKRAVFFVIYFLFFCESVSPSCHQMLYPTAPPLNVVTWIKKIIFERGGGIKNQFGGFIHP